MTSLSMMPPAKSWGDWSRIVLHTARVIVHPTSVVLFKILMTRIIPMVRAVIIESTTNGGILHPVIGGTLFVGLVTPYKLMKDETPFVVHVNDLLNFECQKETNMML